MREYTDKKALLKKVADIRIYMMPARQGGKAIAEEALRLYRDAVLKAIAQATAADVVERAKLTPCDACTYDPPSSGDGRACAMCVARAKASSEEASDGSD